MASRQPLRAVLATLAALLVALSAAGCVSMPSGGPVIANTFTQGAGGQSQNFPHIIPQPPGDGWTEEQIVNGFLLASAAFGDGQQVAKQYLTGAASKSWPPNSWGVIVYKSGPYVLAPLPTKLDSHGQATNVTVTVTGPVQTSLTSAGSYAVTQSKGPVPQTFGLVKTDGQWRIDSTPKQLLLNSTVFEGDYQLRNLYFFDPNGRVLVPHPVYVPLQTTSSALLSSLVTDLINSPKDWLSSGGATTSAFPADTRQLGDVALDGGTATVNLRGAITKAPARLLLQVSAQLLWTLRGTGQGGPAVQSVQLDLDGKPWAPPSAQGNPVQKSSPYSPPDGATKTFYYLDRAGYLVQSNGISSSAGPVRVAKIGAKVTQLAVAAGGRSVAVLRGDSLLAGPVGGKLIRQSGTGYTTMSWDPDGDLWATQGDSIVMFPPGRQSGQQPVPVSVYNNDGTANVGPFTALRIAPDGVRVAVIVGYSSLNFGAISAPAATPGRLQLRIKLSPYYVASPTTMFESVTWYGPDNVITLGNLGPQQPPVVTEYPVSGGTSTGILGVTGMTSVTASAGAYPVIAGLTHSGLMTGGSLSGTWTQLANGTVPVAGTLPVYPV